MGPASHHPLRLEDCENRQLPDIGILNPVEHAGCRLSTRPATAETASKQLSQ